MADDTKLLPCPFCGAENPELTDVLDPSLVCIGHRVECPRCRCGGPGHGTMVAAVEAWNKRADTLGPQAVQLIRAAHRMFKAHEFGDSTFKCPECRATLPHRYREGTGHKTWCAWTKIQSRLLAALKKGGHRA